jgi:hypothetical protein
VHWATFWATFLQTHLVTLPRTQKTAADDVFQNPIKKTAPPFMKEAADTYLGSEKEIGKSRKTISHRARFFSNCIIAF